MLCPDTAKLKDFYKLKNNYNNREDKVSISFEIALCGNERDDCVTDEQVISTLLENMLFSLHFFEEKVDFNNYHRPIQS